jgi:hypothetical protein
VTRRPRVKTCADPSCSISFTGRGLYCPGHQAGRDKPGAKIRRERNRGAKQRQRARAWSERQGVREYRGVITTAPGNALTCGYATAELGHSGLAPVPIDVTGTPGLTVGAAIDTFLAAWNHYRATPIEGSTTP